MRGYLLAGTRISKLRQIFRRNNVSLSPGYFFRWLFLVQNACWASFFSRLEKRKFGKQIASAQAPEDPVIIIGHWRTGSTFLHQLMAYDPQFRTPNLLETTVPDSFLASSKFYRPLMKRMISGTRPMDQVRAGYDEPQEDEYALLRLTTFSPLEKLIFPTSPGYFLNGKVDFLPTLENDRKIWESGIKEFCLKLIIGDTKKRVLFKNPFHSMRIRKLKELFPKAKFIHIYRHPSNIVPSTINMWQIVGEQNKMNSTCYVFEEEDVIRFLGKMWTEIRLETREMTNGSFAAICYEELEKDTIPALKKMYTDLELDFSSEFETNVSSFLDTLKGFRKNSYKENSDLDAKVKTHLSEHLKFFGYVKNKLNG